MMTGHNEAIAAMRQKLEAIKGSRALYFAARDTMVKVSERVADGGLTDGGKLEYEEDYDLYAYAPPAPRKVSGKGKPYKQWKRPPAKPKGEARKIKGGYYESYLAFKKQQGRDKLPFELTGRLRKAYLSSPDAPTSLVEQGDGSAFIFLSGEEAAKYRGLTDSKGRFLQLNVAEKDFYLERFKDLLAE